MKTPDTVAGEITELIMAKISQKLPALPTHEYNRIYEAVMEVLSRHTYPKMEP